VAGFTAGGEYFGSRVAAGFGPFVVLLGQDGADEADDGVAAGEDTDDVGPPPDFLVEALLGVVGAGAFPVRLRDFTAGSCEVAPSTPRP
jgi:hypothetical protein